MLSRMAVAVRRWNGLLPSSIVAAISESR